MTKPFIPCVGDIIRNKKHHWYGQDYSTWKILSYDLRLRRYQLEVVHSKFGNAGWVTTSEADWVRYEMELDTPGKRMVTW